MTKKKTTFELLLFDADGTLFDFERSMRESLRNTLKEYNMPSDDSVIALYSGINQSYWDKYERKEVTKREMRKRRFEDFLTRMGVSHSAEHFESRYLDGMAKLPYLLEGAEKVCGELTARYRMAIVTNGVSSMQRSRIQASPIEGCFEHLFISEEMGAQKPERAFFEQVFKFYPDVRPEKMLIIGDSLSADIKGGNNAGIAACFINRQGKPPQSSADAQADFEIKSLPELRHLLCE